MDYRDFNAEILPNPPPTGKGCSNTFFLLAIGGALALFILFATVIGVWHGQGIILWIGIAVYVTALLWVHATSNDDQEPVVPQKPPIGKLLTLTDEYIAITKDTGVEQFSLNRVKYIFFSPQSRSKFDNPAKYWYCKFKTDHITYNVYLQVEYGQWETLAKKCRALKKRGYNISIG